MKILIVYASAGSGHKKAAEAVYGAFKEKDKDCHVFLVDTLDYTNYFFKRAYPSFYLFLITCVPFIWGVLFYITNNRKIYTFIKPVRLFFERINSIKFQRYLIKEKFDTIISTHFFSSCIVDDLKAKCRIESKLITIVTDYRVHSFWLAAKSDYFVVGGDRAKEDLLNDKIPAEKIKVLGIPIGFKFSVEKDSKVIKERFKILPGKVVVLIMGGGFGIGPYEYFLKKLSIFKERIDLIFVCGHNKKMQERLTRLILSKNLPFKIYGYVNNVDELMQVSDIILTKTGGITSTESLAKQLPLLVINPIPGQEKLNARLMSSLGIVKIVKSKKDAFKFLKGIIEKPEVLDEMKTNISKIIKADTAGKVVKLAKGIK